MSRCCVVCVLVAALAAAFGQPSDAAKGPASAMSRAEFAVRMCTIEPGMSQDEVLKILGKPEDVRTRDDGDWLFGDRIREAWCYGTDGHMTFPTLGRIYFDHVSAVEDIYGGNVASTHPSQPFSGWIDKKGRHRTRYAYKRKPPPPAAMFEEDELRTLLRTIDQSPQVEPRHHCKVESPGPDFHPIKLIKAVNALQPLGKEKALAAIDEYLSVAAGPYGFDGDSVCYILHALFDVPDPPGYTPGIPMTWFRGRDRSVIPRFPLVVLRDIPFHIGGFVGVYSGPAPMPSAHVEQFRDNGWLRTQPLTPSADPFRAFDEFMESPQWKEIHANSTFPRNETYERVRIMEQVLWLVDTVYRVPTDIAGAKLDVCGGWQAAWDKARKEFAKLNVRWDSHSCCYTFENGSTLPEPPQYVRCEWKPTIAGVADAKLIMRRKDADNVEVLLSYEQPLGANVPYSTLDLATVGRRKVVLVSFEIPDGDYRNDPIFKGSGGPVSVGRCGEFKLKQGAFIQAELRTKGKTTRGPAFRP